MAECKDTAVSIAELRSELKALSALTDEKFASQSLALEKAEQALELRLERMNEFRDQINDERSTYVRKDALDALLALLDLRLKKLEGGASRTGGFNTAVGVLITGALAAVAIVIEILRMTTGH